MLRRSALLLTVVGCIAGLVLAGCGSSSSSSSSAAPPPASSQPSTPGNTTTTPKKHFAKTKFVLHFGLAAGAFHRYIYKPFKAGVFGKPASHKLALVKAAAAALFTYHELKLAASDVKSSKILSTLFSPLTALAAKLKAMRAGFLHGKYSPAQINGVQASGGAISATADSKGYPNGDLPVPKL